MTTKQKTTRDLVQFAVSVHGYDVQAGEWLLMRARLAAVVQQDDKLAAVYRRAKCQLCKAWMVER